MKDIILEEKRLGETPLDVIKRIRLEYPDYKDIKMTYAGRLDPMATGKLLILAGDSVHRKPEFLGFDKVYEVKIILGIETDSYDALGISKITNLEDRVISSKDIRQVMEGYIGDIVQSFPPYSSYRVKGKPLHAWANEGRLDEIEIPKKERKIYSTRVQEISDISSEILLKDILKAIDTVKGDFRQKEIISSWKNLLSKSIKFQTVNIVVSCGSGTYMRKLVHDIGRELGVGAFAFSIHRTKIGK